MFYKRLMTALQGKLLKQQINQKRAYKSKQIHWTSKLGTTTCVIFYNLNGTHKTAYLSHKFLNLCIKYSLEFMLQRKY